ncbi:MAG: glycine cleavage system protein H [Thermofilum sp. ex4484_79]|nr:MAG: glycine cleavage system protein H [Thermofilum sp. ex4484_79]
MSEEVQYKNYILLKDRKYQDTHEWIKLIDDKKARVGITDYAQKKLKSIVYIDTPEVGKEIEKGELITTVESIKAVGEIISPVNGTIVAFNEKLEDDPSIINSDPYNEGWIVEIELKNPSELDKLLDVDGYIEVIKKEEGE